MENYPVGAPLPPSPVRWYRRRWFVWSLVVILAALVGGGAWVWFGSDRGAKTHWSEEPQGLVAAKVSRSAGIVINVPKGVQLSAAQAAEHLTFEPALTGRWGSAVSERQLVFQPSKPLEVGASYRVTLAADSVTLAEDFQADEDPKVVAIFPGPDAEAPETSEITIAFNRPMVPLATLGAPVAAGVPVSITPETQGRFVWAGTRILKFVPTTRLHRSSRYHVKVERGLVSVEGLSIEPFESSFTTRPLRYDSVHHEGVTLYSEPVAVKFNQPVDLERTKPLIEVREQGGKKTVPVVVTYGTRTALAGGKDAKPLPYRDKSVLYIYQEKDRHGRERFWDSKTTYQLHLKGAVPLEGETKLTEARGLTFQVPDIIASVSAQSARSPLAEPALFDPQGTLLVSFYEAVDKGRSEIKAPGLAKVEYGERCKVGEDGQEVRVGDGCEKEPNKKQLVLSFDPSRLTAGQAVDVVFEKVVTEAGLRLNAEPLKQAVSVYPELKVLKTLPAPNERGASVTDLTICTNSPLDDAEPENFSKRLKANRTVGRWNWEPAFRVQPQQAGARCAVGQYENRIRYGLEPESPYELELNLVDHFGQQASHRLSFTTGKVASQDRSLSGLQKGYNVTPPERTKLTYAAQNLEYVDVHICEVPVQTALGFTDGPPPQTLPGERLGCQREWQRRVELPRRYWTPSYFQVSVGDEVGSGTLGFFVVSLSHPELREQVYNPKTGRSEPGAQVHERTFLNITNLAAQEKRVQVEEDKGGPERSTERRLLAESRGNLYWVSRIGSLAPVAGATVETYQRKDKKFVSTGSVVTGADGTARSKPYPGDGIAAVSAANDITLVSAQADRFQWASAYRGGEKTYLYTDRPIYRPGQDVHIKGIYRVGFDGSYEVFKDKPAQLKVFSSKNEPVLSQELAVSERGTFGTTYRLPKDAPLGSYRIEALEGYYSFEVAEYVPAPFKVEASSDRDEYVAGEDFAVGVDAQYYFGVPVEGGQVEYSVTAQDYYFDRYRDGHFQFGAGWYYSDEPYYGDSFILRGKLALDGSGKARIAHALDFGKLFREDLRDRSKVFVVRMTVTNGTGQSVSAEKSFIVHRGEFYLGATLERPYFGKNEPNKLLVKSVDTKGTARSVRGVEVSVSKVRWEYFKRQEVDGGYYYHSERKLGPVKKFTVDTDRDGSYAQDFTLGEEGEYEVLVRATDGRGNPVVARQDAYVFGSGEVSIRPLNNESLDLAVQGSEVEVGQRVTVVVKSPYRRAKALVALERGRILDYEIVNVEQNLFNYTFTVKDTYIPNVYATVLLLSPDPAVKFGQVHFAVNTKQKSIQVAVTPGKNHYLPGEEVTLDVSTKDSDGRPVPAEVSLSVADLSVLALVGNPKKDPVAFFYDGRPLGVSTASNIKNVLTEAEVPSGTKGGGGGEPEDLAKKKRGVFKDTAYWNASVVTDAGGRAQVKFKLPDNLTTWQVEGLGVTGDTKLGVGYREFEAKKRLMVVPLHPRFSLPGDEFLIGAKVFNQTGSRQQFSVSIQSPTLELLGQKNESLKLNDGETKTAYFKVRSPVSRTAGEHTAVLSAKGGGFEDTVERVFPIRRNETYEAVATSNFTAGLTTAEYIWVPKDVEPDRGELKVKASATLLGALPEALDYLVGYPYGCTEQVVSKLSAVATAKRLAKNPQLGGGPALPPVTFEGQTYSADDVIAIGLSRMLANQTPEGGFAYYPGMQPDFYLTLHVLNAFQDIRRAGFTIDAAAERRATDYVYQRFLGDRIYSVSKDTLVLVAYTLAQSPQGSAQFAGLQPKVAALLEDQRFLGDQASNLTLTYLAQLAALKFPPGAAERVFAVIETRVGIDARGAYLRPSTAEPLWAYYETPTKDTALLLKAFAAAKRDSVLSEKLIRWLMQSRAKDGAWGSTNNTASVVEALVSYLEWKRELDSRFSLALTLDGANLASKDFTEQTVTGSLEATVPIAKFVPEQLSQLQFTKANKNDLKNGYYYDAVLRYYLPAEQVAPKDEGFAVERQLFALDDREGLRPVSRAQVGQVLRGHLKLVVSKPRNFVAIESYIPAGTELVNFSFATENQDLLSQKGAVSGAGVAGTVDSAPLVLQRPGFFGRVRLWFKGLMGRPTSRTDQAVDELPDSAYSPMVSERVSELMVDNEELHDDRIMLFTERLQPGVYEYDYFIRALVPGTFRHLPAQASELYFPETFGRTGGGLFEVTE